MARKYIEPEWADRAVQMYLDGVPNRDVYKQLGTYQYAYYRVLRERGVFNPKKATKAKEKFKVCPHCHWKKNPLESKYCCFCGQDIRSDGEVLSDKLSKVVRDVAAFFPVSVSDEAISTINEAQKILRKV